MTTVITPAEMRNALDVARLRCKGRLWAVMQPHTYSRVKAAVPTITLPAPSGRTLLW